MMLNFYRFVCHNKFRVNGDINGPLSNSDNRTPKNKEEMRIRIIAHQKF